VRGLFGVAPAGGSVSFFCKGGACFLPLADPVSLCANGPSRQSLREIGRLL